MTSATEWFAPTVDAPRRSRDFVRAVLEAWGVAAMKSVAELVTTELVTNAVRHAVSLIQVQLVYDGALVRIAVYDQDRAEPRVAPQPGIDGGYGLRIVGALAKEWGTSRGDAGKTVWCAIEAE
jgi:anti-sigma regulatory factor (Ser/Thr protein kinase)